jgi:hypothetical protein
MDGLAPVQSVTRTAARQHPRPDAGICDGEVSCQSLRACNTMRTAERKQRTPLSQGRGRAMSPIGTSRRYRNVRFSAARGGHSKSAIAEGSRPTRTCPGISTCCPDHAKQPDIGPERAGALGTPIQKNSGLRRQARPPRVIARLATSKRLRRAATADPLRFRSIVALSDVLRDEVIDA